MGHMKDFAYSPFTQKLYKTAPAGTLCPGQGCFLYFHLYSVFLE